MIYLKNFNARGDLIKVELLAVDLRGNTAPPLGGCFVLVLEDIVEIIVKFRGKLAVDGKRITLRAFRVWVFDH